jgi:deazaflavin-dependent oxidoreductase (nitroreductase family)
MPMGKRSNVVLTHFGRNTGTPYSLKVWFVDIDGEIWIGTEDKSRSWARNLRATGTADLDFGDGPTRYKATEISTAAEYDRFVSAVHAKHPIVSRLIQLLARGKTGCCFRLR